MSFFEHLSATEAPKPEEAEFKLDLCGLEKQEALQRLDRMVTQCKKSGAVSLYVSFDPARPGFGETLFQPVARYFKVEKYNKYVLGAVPVMEAERAGLFVRFRI